MDVGIMYIISRDHCPSDIYMEIKLIMTWRNIFMPICHLSGCGKENLHRMASDSSPLFMI